MTTEVRNAPLLESYISLYMKTKDVPKHGERYTEFDKDIAAYEYLSAGNAFHDFKNKNLKTISRSTILRHIDKHTRHIEEGKVFIYSKQISSQSVYSIGLAVHSQIAIKT